MASRYVGSKESFMMMVCAAVSLTGSCAALGFGCVIVLYIVLRLRVLVANCLLLMEIAGFTQILDSMKSVCKLQSSI